MADNDDLPPAPTWQADMFRPMCSESVAEQAELFSDLSQYAKPVIKGPRIKDLRGQTFLFGDHK